MGYNFDITTAEAVIYDNMKRPILKIDNINDVTMRNKEITITCESVVIEEQKQDKYRVVFDDGREDKYYE